MDNMESILDYFKKLEKAIDNADVTILKYKLVKKSRIDDLLVCTLAVLPESFKKAMKKRLNLDVYPSVACYNRLSKIIKKPFFFFSDFYIIDYAEAKSMLYGISRNIVMDIKNLEEE